MSRAANRTLRTTIPEEEIENGHLHTSNTIPNDGVIVSNGQHPHVHHPHHKRKSVGSKETIPDEDRLYVTAYRIRVGPPQFIRISGLRKVLDRYQNQLDQATCVFGTEEVPCRCDTLLGAVECELPRYATTAVVARDDCVVVRVRIADFESSPLSFRYLSTHVRDRPKSEATYLFPGNNRLNANTSYYGYGNDENESGGSDTDNDGKNSESEDGNEDGKDKPPNSLHTRLLSIIRREKASKNGGRTYSLLHQCIAEFVGTMFIVIFGVGAVISAIVFDVADLWHVTVLWGFGIAFAILVAGSISGAHLNPAVSLALALFRPHQFPFSKLLPFWAAQYFGGFIGGALNLMLFGPAIDKFESDHGIIRGMTSGNTSVVTASGFGEYFPAPKAIPADQLLTTVSSGYALLIEAFGTAMLMFMILTLTDSRQKMLFQKDMFPFYIGFTIATLMTLYGPITQVGLNPARDFGPRLVAVMAGWGGVAIPGPNGGFWVYIIGPKIGACVGALFYDFLISPGL